MRHDLQKVAVANAAGMVKSLEEASALLATDVTIVTVGSVKEESWPGNIGETYYFDPVSETAWNSKGIPTSGIAATLPWLSVFRHECRAAGKQLCVNIAGSSPKQYGDLAEELYSLVDLIEVNAGCPNLWGPGGQEPIASYDPELLSCILTEVENRITGKCRIAVKISPVGDELIPRLARLFERHELVTSVIAVNTLPNQEGTREDGSPALAFRTREGEQTRHQGGMSGSALKPHGLRVIGGLRDCLGHSRIRLIGCGGIFTGRDAVDYLDEGADGFAIGTAFFERGPRIFSEVLAGAYEIVQSR
ncbi:MAG: hypothetical protein V4644_03490 [Patescibacteria group bacterium]